MSIISHGQEANNNNNKKKKTVHLDHELKGIFMPKLIWEPLVLFSFKGVLFMLMTQ